MAFLCYRYQARAPCWAHHSPVTACTVSLPISCAETLTPSTSKGDLVWRWGVYNGHDAGGECRVQVDEIYQKRRHKEPPEPCVHGARARGVTGRRRLSARSGGRPPGKPVLPAPSSCTSGLQDLENRNFSHLSPQFMALSYGGPSRKSAGLSRS